jgi:hypothetical protein
MTAIITKDDLFARENGQDITCNRCGKVAGYPRSEIGENFCLCAECCHDIRKCDLAVDIAHLAAIVDLQRLGYSGSVLVRKTVEQAEEDALRPYERPRRKEIDFEEIKFSEVGQ